MKMNSAFTGLPSRLDSVSLFISVVSLFFLLTFLIHIIVTLKLVKAGP